MTENTIAQNTVNEDAPSSPAKSLKRGNARTRFACVNEPRSQGSVDPKTRLVKLGPAYKKITSEEAERIVAARKPEVPVFRIEHEYVPIETVPSNLAAAVSTVAIASSTAAVSRGKPAEAPQAPNLPDSLNPIRKMIVAQEPVKKE